MWGFEGILNALLHDAAEKTNILIKGKEEDCRVILEFSNTGFGIPHERFQSFMNGEAEPTSKEFIDLRQSIRRIESWGGNASATSATGDGLRITIALNVFICQA